MNKDAEDFLFERIPLIDEMRNNHAVFTRDVIQEMVDKKMISSPKQAWRTLEKWSDKGVYQWGSFFDLGWKVRKEAVDE